MSKPNTNIIRCTHCGSYEYKKNGKSNGHQNYICKKCKRSFSDRVKKFTYDDKERFLKYYLNNVGIRKAAKFMNCSPSLLIKWLREFINNLKLDLDKAKNKLDKNIPDIIEMDEIYTRIKKGLIKHPYGLLILDGEIKLLQFTSEKELKQQKNYIIK